MTANELFDALEVASDSPRLKWVKKHQIRIHFAAHMCGPDEEAFCAWLPTNDAYPLLRKGNDYDGVPNNPDECGYGKTEEDALVSLAKCQGMKLWFEMPDTEGDR